ncbi:MAG: MlaC/ttg2D family ABC transporter substrate-binding protein [Oceanococcus sp.]
MKLRLITSLILAVSTFPLWANEASTDLAQEQVETSPDALIQAVAQKLLTSIQAERAELETNPDKLFTMVSDVVLPHFDFPLMSRLVLGPGWENASEQQQERFLQGFKTLLVKTYSNALLQYSNQKVSFDPAVPGEKPSRATVKSTIKSPGADPVFMHYRMRQKDAQWLVYDVVVDNISLITNYRGTYASEVKRNGLDSLIQKLEEQTKG